MNKKSFLFVFAAFFYAFFCIFCSWSDSSEKTWILAAEKFSLTQKNTNQTMVSLCSSMPSLILENFAENLERLPRSREQLDRTLYDLQTARLSLFIQLSKEVQTRDAIFLNNYSERKLKSKLKEENKKIADIEKQIAENLDLVQKETEKRAFQIEQDEKREKRIDEGFVVEEEKKENKFASLFKGMMKNETNEVSLEKVSVYQNDFTKLFDAGEKIKERGYDSFEFEKACVDAKINGLISGKITVYGSYISVSVEVREFPGSRVICYASDVGSTENLKALALSLTMQITPRIADSMPVELEISVLPQKAKEKLVVTVDDIVFNNSGSSEKPLVVQSGVHSILFSSSGFETVSANYNFSGNRKFKIDVEMKEEQNGEVHIRLKKPYSGDIFGNAVFGGSVSSENPYGTIKINNQPILGHFITEDGVGADFYVAEKYLNDGIFLFANAKPFDRSDCIDKRRHWMYASYSALIVSLMPAFYCYGTSYAKTMAYNDGHDVSRSEAQNWQYASWATTGISISCGVFFVYELVRYLKAASTVLPVNAKPVSKKELKRIQAENARKAEEAKNAENSVTNVANDADFSDQADIATDAVSDVDFSETSVYR